MAAKKDFTIADMRKAFVAGAELAQHDKITGGWDFDRWIRNHYAARYERKAKPKARKAA